MSFTAITYNIYFGKEYILERTKSLVDLLLEKPYDLIFLQEVTPIVLEYLRQSPLKSYFFSKNSLSQGYDTLILSKTPLEYHLEVSLYESKMGRKLEMGFYQGMLVGTSHLESIFPPHSTETKKKQFQEIFIISQEYTNARYPKKNIPILLGLDTNLTPNECYQTPNKWKDLFQEAGSPSPIEYTYDYQRNDLVKGKYKGRLDRFFFYQKKHNLDLKDYQLIGQEEVCPKVFTSDHFGVEIVLQRNL